MPEDERWKAPVVAVRAEEGGGASEQRAVALATSLPPEPNALIVVAAGQGWSAEDLVAACAERLGRRRADHRRRLRLVAAGAAVPDARGTIPAQVVADRLDVDVIAPDGALMVVPGGWLFVVADGKPGSWVHFRPGQPAYPTGARYPVPHWEWEFMYRTQFARDTVVAEEVPAGLWLRPQGPANPTNLAFSLPPDPDSLAIVVSGLGRESPSPGDVSALILTLPTSIWPRVVIVPYGPLRGNANPGKFGSAVADLLGEPIRMSTGMPLHTVARGRQVIAVTTDDTPTWRPFATELLCYPGPIHAPEIIDWVSPFPGNNLTPMEPHALDDHWVIELVPAGLWIRPKRRIDGAEIIRRLPPEAERCTIVAGAACHGSAPPPEVVARALHELPPDAQRVLRLLVPTKALHRLPIGRKWRKIAADRLLSSFARAASSAAPAALPATARPAPVVVRVPTMPPPDVRAQSPLDTRAPSLIDIRSPYLMDAGAPPPSDTRAPSPMDTGTPSHIGPHAPSHTDPRAPSSMGNRRPSPLDSRAAAPMVTGAPSPSNTDSPSGETIEAVGRPPQANLYPRGGGGLDNPGNRGGPRQDFADNPATTPPQLTSSLPAVPLPSSPTPPDLGAALGGDPQVVTDAMRVELRVVLGSAANQFGRPTTPDERAVVRAAMGSRYSQHSRAIEKALAEHRGLRAASNASDADLTDLVAVRAFLGDAPTMFGGLDRPADLDLARAHLMCVGAGLSRLPPYAGPVYCAAPAGFGDMTRKPQDVITEDGFLVGTTDAATDLHGGAEWVVMSLSGRQLAGLVRPERRQEVVFAPGTRFRVLDVAADITHPSRPRLLVAEVPVQPSENPPESDLAQLRAAAARRDAVPMSRRVMASQPSWLYAAVDRRTAGSAAYKVRSR